MEEVARRLAGAGGATLRPVNVGGDIVNLGCGADFVQKEIKPAKNCERAAVCVSLDGDADRAVYFVPAAADGSAPFLLFDGDKIAALAAMEVQSRLVRQRVPAAGAPMLRLPRLSVALRREGQEYFIFCYSITALQFISRITIPGSPSAARPRFVRSVRSQRSRRVRSASCKRHTRTASRRGSCRTRSGARWCARRRA